MKCNNSWHLRYTVQVIIQDPEDSAYVFEQHLKRDVEQLAITIPDVGWIEYSIKYELTQPLN